MVPHASAQTGLRPRTCHLDYDCEGNQFCAKPGFVCQQCVNCTEHLLENKAGISCPESVLDCGPCLSGDGCEPLTPAGNNPENAQPMYVWVLMSLTLVLIIGFTALCLFRLLKKKLYAESHTSIFHPDAETAGGAPHARGAASAQSSLPNYNSAVNNNNDNSYVPVQLRPSSPALDTLDYNSSYPVPTQDYEESRHMLAKQSNPLHVTGLKERDLNQAAVVFRNAREPPPSYDALDVGTEELPEEEETLDSIWVPSGTEAPQGSAPPAVEFRGLLGEARGTVLLRPPRYEEGVGDTNEEPPTKLQRTEEEQNPTDTNENESSSSAQLSITDVTTTTQGSNAIALPTPRLDLANASGRAHHNNGYQSRAGTSGNPPHNGPSPQNPEPQNGQSGNLMVNISIQQVNLKNIKI